MASLSTPFVTPADRELVQRISERLRNEALLGDARIEVDVRGGHATLRGSVPSYPAKLAAAAAAAHCDGLAAAHDHLSVQLPSSARRTDAGLRDAVLEALVWKARLPRGMIEVAVNGGAVTLTGQVDWTFQKRLAEATIAPLSGVISITNRVRVSDRQIEMELLTQVRAALRAAAERHADALTVQMRNGVATLRGPVPSGVGRELICAVARAHAEVHELRDEMSGEAAPPPCPGGSIGTAAP
jgi:hyperosmotically inducible periplasmic protein